MPRTATTAANPAIPAGLSAPPCGRVCGEVTVGGVTGFPAVPFEFVEGVPVLFADGTTPLETLAADTFADTCAKPELAVTTGVDVATTVAFDEEVTACAVAEYAETSSSNWLTMGAISWRTSVASACRKLVMTGWREVGMAVTQEGKGAEGAVT